MDAWVAPEHAGVLLDAPRRSYRPLRMTEAHVLIPGTDRRDGAHVSPWDFTGGAWVRDEASGSPGAASTPHSSPARATWRGSRRSDVGRFRRRSHPLALTASLDRPSASPSASLTEGPPDTGERPSPGGTPAEEEAPQGIAGLVSRVLAAVADLLGRLASAVMADLTCDTTRRKRSAGPSYFSNGTDSTAEGRLSVGMGDVPTSTTTSSAPSPAPSRAPGLGSPTRRGHGSLTQTTGFHRSYSGAAIGSPSSAHLHHATRQVARASSRSQEDRARPQRRNSRLGLSSTQADALAADGASSPGTPPAPAPAPAPAPHQRRPSARRLHDAAAPRHPAGSSSPDRPSPPPADVSLDHLLPTTHLPGQLSTEPSQSSRSDLLDRAAPKPGPEKRWSAFGWHVPGGRGARAEDPMHTSMRRRVDSLCLQVLKESMALSSRPAALPRRGTDATGDADSYLPWDAAVPSEMAELRPRVSARKKNHTWVGYLESDADALGTSERDWPGSGTQPGDRHPSSAWGGLGALGARSGVEATPPLPHLHAAPSLAEMAAGTPPGASPLQMDLPLPHPRSAPSLAEAGSVPAASLAVAVPGDGAAESSVSVGCASPGAASRHRLGGSAGTGSEGAPWSGAPTRGSDGSSFPRGSAGVGLLAREGTPRGFDRVPGCLEEGEGEEEPLWAHGRAYLSDAEADRESKRGSGSRTSKMSQDSAADAARGGSAAPHPRPAASRKYRHGKPWGGKTHSLRALRGEGGAAAKRGSEHRS